MEHRLSLSVSQQDTNMVNFGKCNLLQNMLPPSSLFFLFQCLTVNSQDTNNYCTLQLARRETAGI